MKYGPLLILVSVLSACQSLAPLTSPSPEKIAAAARVLADTALAGNPSAYVKVGYSIVERECTTFFDALAKAQDEALFAQQQLNLISTATTGVLTAVSAGTVPIAISGILGPLSSNSLGNARTTLLITAYPDETYGLIKSALKTYRDNASAPADIYDAGALVQNYAGICTYSGIHQLARQAISKAKTAAEQPTTVPAPATPSPPTAALAPTPLISPPSRALIPNVIVY